MGNNQARVYNDSNTPLIHKLDWMKDIPDNTKFSQMTIPGTHDSCSTHGLCCCAWTQTWSLIEQMRAGLRYFDIRVRMIDNTLRAFHGFVDQIDTTQSFGIVLDKVDDCLSDLWWRHLAGSLTELSHLVILLCSCNLHFSQTGGITFYLYSAAWFGKDRLFGEVREDEHEGGRLLYIGHIHESTIGHLDGVEVLHPSVRTIDIKFSLIDTSQSTLDAETTSVVAA